MDENRLRLHRVLGVYSPLLFLADAAVVWLGASLAGAGLQFFAGMDWLWPLSKGYDLVTLSAMVLMPLFYFVAGGYRAWRGADLAPELSRLAGAWFFVMLAIMAAGYLTKTSSWFSRPWMAAWFVATLVLLVVVHALIRSLMGYLRRQGLDVKTVVLVGGGSLGSYVARSIRTGASSAGLHLAGYFSDDDEGEIAGGCPYLGRLAEVPAYLQRNEIDQLWLALPFRYEDEIRKLFFELRHLTIDIRMVPDIFGYQLLNHSVEQVVGLPVLNLSLSPQQGLDGVLKSLMDRSLAVILLLLLAPLLLALAVAVKLSSPGPILFRQTRHGWDGAPIVVYKFRTMRAHPAEAGVYRQATRDDNRVTGVGRWLRRSSADELPQLINVLQGSMSLVGPRPHPVEMNEFYKDKVEKYMLRHKVKPGMTGWAQVNGLRGETESLDKLQKRIEHDLYYVEHWSLCFDLKILVLTVLTVLSGIVNKNAY